jgi:proline dehydrogenase
MGLKEVFLLPVAKRWIAGADLDSAIKVARKANSRGLGVVVNFLGEEISDLSMADSHTEEYLRLQRAMADESINGKPSVKLTQLGLFLDQAQAASRLEKIAANSERLNQWLWIDMEGTKFTDATLTIYETAHEKHGHLGVALQSYLKRSVSDLKPLLDRGAKIRLVKGAYRESHDLVYTSRNEIRDSFIRAMKMLFEQGDGFAIGTHDSVLIDEAKRLAESKHVDFEFELLKGIRDELKDDLVKSGYKVSEYLPYGDQWYNYSKRRISEHPSNVWLLLRSLF